MNDERVRPSGVQDAVEDVFGFNFRSLKTLRDLFVRPNAVFRAYAERDRVSYTPALRLWLGLLGAQFLVALFGGGYKKLIRNSFEQQSADVIATYEDVTGGRMDEFLDIYADAMSLAQPFVIGLASSLSVFLLAAFRRGMAWSARLNIAMAVLSAGSVAGILATPITMTEGLPAIVVFATTIPVVAMYFITFVRGSPGVLADTTGGAWVKGGLFSLALIGLLVIGYVVLGIGTSIYALIRLGAFN